MDNDETIKQVREGRAGVPLTPVRDGLSAIPLTPMSSAEERGRQPIANTPIQPPATQPGNSGNTGGTSNTGGSDTSTGKK